MFFCTGPHRIPQREAVEQLRVDCLDSVRCDCQHGEQPPEIASPLREAIGNALMMLAWIVVSCALIKGLVEFFLWTWRRP